MIKRIFSWKGLTKQGLYAKGEIVAPSLTIARILLQQQDIHSLIIRRRWVININKIKTSQIIISFRQLATLLQANIPLVTGLETLIQIHDNSSMMRSLWMSIKQDVAAGLTFSQALSKYPRYFPHHVCQFVIAGEQTGMLAHIVAQLATYQENMWILKKRIQKALFYPAVVLLMSVVITLGLMLFIVPQFEQLFANVGASLPWITRIVLLIAQSLEHQGLWWCTLVIMLIILLLFLRKHNKTIAALLSQCSLKFPIFGHLRHQVIAAKTARTLAMGYSAGVAIVDALMLTANIVGQVHYQHALCHTREAVIKGETLARALMHTRCFSPLFIQMVAVGEQAGALNVMLLKVAEWYESQIDQTIDQLGDLIEPVLMIFLGLIIGGLVVAMYLPVFQLGKVI